MLVVAAATVSIYLVNTRVYGPEAKVEEYLDALRAGDGGLALGLLNAAVPEGADAALLDGEPLAESVTDLQVQDISAGDASGGQVPVAVTYTLGGSEGRTEFALRRAGTSWMFFTRWEFVPSTLPTVQVSAPNLAEAGVNGARVALPEGTGTFAAFYPGRVGASYASKYFEAPEEAAVVESSSTSARLPLSTRATPALVEDVQEQVRGFLDGCTEGQNRLAPPGCPFYHFTNNRVEEPITWEIVEYPEVEISAGNQAWVVAPLNGRAKVTATETDLFTGAKKPLVAETDFSFAARLSVGQDSAVLTPLVD
ncbi:hypothetical protein BN1051_02523 [Arthrobacter saudimassiliensis]|uniref:Uncharacterized protein n=1 Tax=Arthrobacter saudimassiliensis TaxID=1461584 RepID=A0A078MWH5_9MICC|nr:hypothetical protein BN1051_02523 [Arthrobacter saudimassiliensis]